mmetsp:Transcript_6682/g.15361  ORF Transcript_6682/g.15361 Transcript_6682/m.15361 type:complete len:401 (+) Transcript_6682:99-1301(+)
MAAPGPVGLNGVQLQYQGNQPQAHPGAAPPQGIPDRSSHSVKTASSFGHGQTPDVSGRFPTDASFRGGLPPVTAADVSAHGQGSETDFSTHGWSMHPSRAEIKLEKSIAKGSCGEVHRGKFRGQTVAVKILKAQAKQDKSSLARRDFYHETRIHSGLNHPNIVAIHGYNIAEDPPFIIYEFMGGGSLDSYMADRSRRAGKWQPSKTWVPPRDISFPWICDVLRALVYLHEGLGNPIIHRDLKPANLMLSNDFHVMKLADFGLSKRIDGRSTPGRQMTGDTGTLRYMAPEIFRKEHTYNEKVDIYSLAIIMYQLTTGAPAYAGETNMERRIDAVAHKGFRASTQGAEWPQLAQLIEQAWQGDASLRPSARSLLRMMEGLPGRPEPGVVGVHMQTGCQCTVL